MTLPCHGETLRMAVVGACTATPPTPCTSRRGSDMDDQHAKGTVSKIEGKVEEVAGKVTGNKGRQLHGKAKQIQGSGQQALGDVQDAVRKADADPTRAR